MRTGQMLGLLGCLLLSSAAGARTGTVTDVVDHTDAGPGKAYWFWNRVETLDHSPHYRHCWEDWGWTHDLTGRLPSDVNAIVSAQLVIKAWDVNPANPGSNPPVGPEIDRITVNDTVVGDLMQMPVGYVRQWTTTTFDLAPVLLQELYRDRMVDVFMNIDLRVEDGHRVLLDNSTLIVNYTATGDVPEPNVALYRFWSPTLSSHFYTVSEGEKEYLIQNYPTVWTYEGVAYRAFGHALDGDLKPVYRFWSDSLGSHFYTISEEEADNLVTNWAHVWVFEGIEFYAYPDGTQPPESKPVYRFWSSLLGKHFFTISEEEKQFLIDNYAYVWTPEGVAWYAYDPL